MAGLTTNKSFMKDKMLHFVKKSLRKSQNNMKKNIPNNSI